MMDPMKRVAAGAVRKNLGPDPSMGRKVELLRRLVAMRRNPKATTNPPKRGSLPRMPGRERRQVPTRLPRPAQFADKPGYNFGPPRGM